MASQRDCAQSVGSADRRTGFHSRLTSPALKLTVSSSRRQSRIISESSAYPTRYGRTTVSIRQGESVTGAELSRTLCGVHTCSWGFEVVGVASVHHRKNPVDGHIKQLILSFGYSTLTSQVTMNPVFQRPQIARVGCRKSTTLAIHLPSINARISSPISVAQLNQASYSCLHGRCGHASPHEGPCPVSAASCCSTAVTKTWNQTAKVSRNLIFSEQKGRKMPPAYSNLMPPP